MCLKERAEFWEPDESSLIANPTTVSEALGQVTPSTPPHFTTCGMSIMTPKLEESEFSGIKYLKYLVLSGTTYYNHKQNKF